MARVYHCTPHIAFVLQSNIEHIRNDFTFQAIRDIMCSPHLKLYNELLHSEVGIFYFGKSADFNLSISECESFLCGSKSESSIFRCVRLHVAHTFLNYRRDENVL